jgi:hypothetical protein
MLIRTRVAGGAVAWPGMVILGRAGHLIDGAIESPLLPEHRSCNVRASNRKRGTAWLRTSKAW